MRWTVYAATEEGAVAAFEARASERSEAMSFERASQVRRIPGTDTPLEDAKPAKKKAAAKKAKKAKPTEPAELATEA
jgi:hypothetical protein